MVFPYISVFFFTTLCINCVARYTQNFSQADQQQRQQTQPRLRREKMNMSLYFAVSIVAEAQVTKRKYKKKMAATYRM